VIVVYRPRKRRNTVLTRSYFKISYDRARDTYCIHATTVRARCAGRKYDKDKLKHDEQTIDILNETQLFPRGRKVETQRITKGKLCNGVFIL